MASQARLMGYFGIVAGVSAAVAVAMGPEQLRASAWVAYLACAAFVFAGVACLARAYERPNVANHLAVVILGAMLAIELWIAFGAGA